MPLILAVQYIILTWILLLRYSFAAEASEGHSADNNVESELATWKIFSIRGAAMFVAFGIISMPRSILAALCVVLVIAVPLIIIAIVAVMLRITTVEALHSIIPWEQWPRVLILYMTLLISALLVSYRMHTRIQRERRWRGGVARIILDPSGELLALGSGDGGGGGGGEGAMATGTGSSQGRAMLDETIDTPQPQTHDDVSVAAHAPASAASSWLPTATPRLLASHIRGSANGYTPLPR